MELRTKLMSLKKATVTIQELRRLTGLNSDVDLFPVVQDAIVCGLLKPFRNVATNGNRLYPIYEKYHIVREKTDETGLYNAIQKLHPLMQANDYLKNHPNVFQNHQDSLEALSSWLFHKPVNPISVSRKERSFEIFGAEKVLDDSSIKNVLNRLQINEETLCFYDTPSYCFHDYILQRRNQMCLLICENKDIWFNLRKMLYEYRRNELWRISIDGVIYGEGNRICEVGALTEYTRFLGVDTVQYLYWGDIDREGLNIAVRLLRNNPKLKIVPFREAYLQMLERAKQFKKHLSDDTRERMEDYAMFLDAFEENEQVLLFEAMQENLHIPQEIISFAVLLDEMR